MRDLKRQVYAVHSHAVRVLAVILFAILFASSFLVPSAFAAGGATSSLTTEGGTWVQLPGTTDEWGMDKNGDGKYEITAKVTGTTVRYSFEVDDENAEYYVYETFNPNLTETFILKDSNGNPLPYVKIEQNTKTVDMNNKRGKNGNLKITKVLKDDTWNTLTADQDSTQFEFTVTLKYYAGNINQPGFSFDYQPGPVSYGPVSFNWPTGYDADGNYTTSAKVYLRAGESVELTGIPEWVEYYVEETTPPAGYSQVGAISGFTSADDPTGYNAQYITADNTVSLTATNSRDPGTPPPPPAVTSEDLKLLKTVTDSSGAEDSTDTTVFDYTLSFIGLTANTAYSYTVYNADDTQASAGTVTADADGMASKSIQLSTGQYAIFSALPADAQYKVKEDAAPDYTASFRLEAEQGKTLKPAEVSRTAAAANTSLSTAWEKIDSGEGTVTVHFTNKKEPPPPIGELIVKKTVLNDDGTAAQNDTTAFIFTASFLELEPNADYSYEIYDAAGGRISGPLTFTSGADSTADVNFNLSNGQYLRFLDLPVGCRYIVLEGANAGYTAQYQLANAVTAVKTRDANTSAGLALNTALETLDPAEGKDQAAAPVCVDFTNTLPPPPPPAPETVNVSVIKSWDDGGSHAGESIKFYLLRSTNKLSLSEGDRIDMVILDGTESTPWAHTFENLTKYQPNGVDPYYYYIKEEPSSGYHAVLTVTGAMKPDPTFPERQILDYTKDYCYNIKNISASSVEFPKTGGEGVLPFIAAGLALTLIPAVILLRLRRKKAV